MHLRRLGAVLLCLMFTLLLRTGLARGQVGAEPIARFRDAQGDDAGAGNLLYPDHRVYVPGLFDLLEFVVSQDEDNVYFDFQFAALTNPFQAPEGYFHQRIEVYIHTGLRLGRTALKVGSHNLQTAPELGWDLRLSISPFDEAKLYVIGEDNRVQVFSEEVTSFCLADNKTVRLQIRDDVLPQPNSAWGYYVLIGSFDGLAEDFWRDLGEGPWQVGGDGLPIFDILAPRLGTRSQKVQLSKGVLYPVFSRRALAPQWFWRLLVIVFALGSFCVWRWQRG